MSKATHLSLALGLVAATFLAVACRDATSPKGDDIGQPSFGVKKPEPPKKPPPSQPANFRLTGGGRTDERNHTGFAKSTPQSHDFATFGFQARPAGDNGAGRGNITWVEHWPEEFGNGFTFHGRVERFSAADGDGVCGAFAGPGRMRTRDGQTFADGLSFLVEHACDVDEPGVGSDHIRIQILLNGTLIYDRHGLLSGGNIQWHKAQ